MRRSRAVTVPSVLVLSILFAAALLSHGCGGSSVKLGPKPAIHSGQAVDQSQSVDEMRAWLESLSGEDAKKLEETGRVTFPYQDLKRSDPAHSQIVDRYVKTLAASLAEGMRAQGMQAPHFDVQRVSFIREAPGAYQLEIRWAPNGGTKVALSDPL
jgi:hypothetical protein